MQPADGKPVLVVSHERSGTHFLMNTLAAEFGYVARPMANFDSPEVAINFHHQGSILKYFMETANARPEVIRKAHHQFAFVDKVIGHLVKAVNIFYICRDPRDVAHSFRHALNEWPWFEGPRVATSGEFIRAQPAGRLLRYQYHQLPDMLERWRVHVEGWTAAAAKVPQITVVRYEDLDQRYGEALDRIAEARGWTRQHGPRPKIDQQTVLKTKRGSPSNTYSEQDLAYFRERAGPTMARLGYRV